MGPDAGEGDQAGNQNPPAAKCVFSEPDKLVDEFKNAVNTCMKDVTKIEDFKADVKNAEGEVPKAIKELTNDQKKALIEVLNKLTFPKLVACANKIKEDKRDKILMSIIKVLSDNAENLKVGAGLLLPAVTLKCEKLTTEVTDLEGLSVLIL